jgi:hypothetical protein
MRLMLFEGSPSEVVRLRTGNLPIPAREVIASRTHMVAEAIAIPRYARNFFEANGFAYYATKSPLPHCRRLLRFALADCLLRIAPVCQRDGGADKINADAK